MNQSSIDIVNDGIKLIRCCPFCAGGAHVSFQGLKPLLYGIHCRNCGAGIPARYTSQQKAIQVWNRRSGLASLGGRATRGIRSRRKLAAARRNLKRARKLTWLRREIDAAMAVIKPFHDKEMAENEAALREDLAWLREREQLIFANPVLREMYESLLAKRAAAAPTESPNSGITIPKRVSGES